MFLFAPRDAVLASDEAEAVAEFEQEGLQARDEPILQLALLDGAVQAEEVEARLYGLLSISSACSAKCSGTASSKLCAFFSVTARS